MTKEHRGPFSDINWKSKLPLIVGSLAILSLAGYLAVHRSSPGDLAAPHMPVAGGSLITDCNKCHGSNEKGMAGQCLKCHVEIQTELNKKRGYHYLILQNKHLECGRCHSEHNGVQFPLINPVSWEHKDPKKFDHKGLDFHLVGKHVTLECEKCHQRKGLKPFVLPNFQEHPRKTTFMGMTQTCTDCHEDPHEKGWTKTCERCHNQDKWKPTQPLFDHEKFFTLVGSHAKVTCIKCHPAPTAMPATPSQKFPFDSVVGKKCAACHKNPHFAKWTSDCESCHLAPVPWKDAVKKVTPALHQLTGFRLWKPHDKARCDQCHGGQDPALKFADKYHNPKSAGYNRQEAECQSCHKDAHKGQFTPRHKRCMDCHQLRFFQPPRYAAADHKTWPLTGRHAVTKCNSCHLKTPPSTVRQFVPLAKACANCHRDIHLSQFDEKGVTRCERCHLDPASFKKVIFNHDTARFKLDAAHRNVACKDCHPVVVTRKGNRIVQYKPLRMKCEDCHEFAK